MICFIIIHSPQCQKYIRKLLACNQRKLVTIHQVNRRSAQLEHFVFQLNKMMNKLRSNEINHHTLTINQSEIKHGN